MLARRTTTRQNGRMEGRETEDADSLEPPALPQHPGYEYAFDTHRAMELQMANRLEKGESADELRDAYLAEGRGASEVDSALVGADTRLVAKRREERRKIWNKRFLRLFVLSVFLLLVAAQLVPIFR